MRSFVLYIVNLLQKLTKRSSISASLILKFRLISGEIRGFGAVQFFTRCHTFSPLVIANSCLGHVGAEAID